MKPPLPSPVEGELGFTVILPQERQTLFGCPSPSPPQEGGAVFKHVTYEIVWMVQIDSNSSGQIQWAEYAAEVQKPLEELYQDDTRGKDDYVM